MASLDSRILEDIYRLQRNEITKYAIYSRIAASVRDAHNRGIIKHIAYDERSHTEVLKEYTKKEASPHFFKVIWYSLLSRLFGFTFALKLIAKGKEMTHRSYAVLYEHVPELKKFGEDEDRHEEELVGMLDEEGLQYVGSMVLGLSDALVELTGTLAGLTLALRDTRLIALSGLITGISATLSMASSEYLRAKAQGRRDALKSGLYTGVAYIVTVALMTAPFLIFPREGYFPALGVMAATVILVIMCFNYYVSVAKDVPFWRRFAEMAGISLGVAAISFVIGILVKNALGIDI
ncbi:MAG: VIT1/CCC1 transporter family protein [Christensenellales bacterium]